MLSLEIFLYKYYASRVLVSFDTLPRKNSKLLILLISGCSLIIFVTYGDENENNTIKSVLLAVNRCPKHSILIPRDRSMGTSYNWAIYLEREVNRSRNIFKTSNCKCSWFSKVWIHWVSVQAYKGVISETSITCCLLNFRICHFILPGF